MATQRHRAQQKMQASIWSVSGRVSLEQLAGHTTHATLLHQTCSEVTRMLCYPASVLPEASIEIGWGFSGLTSCSLKVHARTPTSRGLLTAWMPEWG